MVLLRRLKMFWIKPLLVSAVLVTCVIGLSSALKCYQCKSDTNPACADPFDSAGAAKGGNSSEPKTCTKAEDKSDPWNDLMLYDAGVCYKFKYGDGTGNYSSHIYYLLFIYFITNVVRL